MHPKITYVALYMFSTHPWVSIHREKIIRFYPLTNATAWRFAKATEMIGTHLVDGLGWSWRRA